MRMKRNSIKQRVEALDHHGRGDRELAACLVDVSRAFVLPAAPIGSARSQ
jgi:hypothetical protein